jgi:biopolymer transport protein ExbD
MQKPPDRPQSAINVTPLVDVCLVLLIIFMVVTPMLDKNGAVRLPEGANPAPRPDERGKTVVAVQKDGSIWYGGKWLPPADLLARLREDRERSGAKELVLYADAGLTFAEVRGAMRLVQEAGYPGVSLAAKKTPQ